MLYLLIVWLFIQLISFVILPISVKLFSSLPDRGYSLNKSFALVLYVYLVWLASSLHLLPFTQTAIILVGLIISLFSVAIFLRNFSTQNSQSEHPKAQHYLLVEAVFFLLFVIFAYLKYRTPAIYGTEKPMDFALINGIFRSRFFPPNDAWYANASINYYYYGHYLVAFISKITSIPTRIIYNLALPLIFALTGVNIFGIISNSGKGDHKRYFFAFLGIILVLFASNFDTTIQVVRAALTNTTAAISWWNPSRVIGRSFFSDPNGYLTITEFPLFSLLLGDVHAHVLALLFGSLFLGICLAYFRKPSFSIVILGSLVLANLGMTNPWEIPGYLFLTFFLIIFSTSNLDQILRRLVLGGTCFLILLLPFLLNFQPIVPVNDPKPFISFISNVASIGRHTLLSEFLTIWGTHLALLAVVILTLRRKLISKINTFPFILCFSGLALLIFCELFFINDFFQPPLERLNTVFKFYYQAWLILGVGVVALFFNFQSSLFKNKIILLATATLLLGNFGYLIFALPVRLGEFQPDAWTLDGLKYLSFGTLANQADLAAIDWFNRNVVESTNIVESAADSSGSTSYTQVGRISAATGLPTIIGWSAVNHEGGWRNSSPEVTERVNDARTIYESSNLETVRHLLQKYQVKYVVMGEQERSSYPKGDFKKFVKLGNQVFVSGPTEIYQVF